MSFASRTGIRKFGLGIENANAETVEVYQGEPS